jgi:hypothetical protein
VLMFTQSALAAESQLSGPECLSRMRFARRKLDPLIAV